jgi:hypothetical protein
LSRSYILIVIIISCSVKIQAQEEMYYYGEADTSYHYIATPRIINMIKGGKAPWLTLQLYANYNIGHLDLAANDNTYFNAADFTGGRNFGTRYGYGGTLTGKISMHREGNIRLTVSMTYNRFQSNFIISASPEGKVMYNVFSPSIGIENNFSPDRKVKPFIGIDFAGSIINGEATLTTDTADFKVKIKNSLRFGVSINLGFEYSLNNHVGLIAGYRLNHANILGKESKISSAPNETYLNDEKIPVNSEPIPYAGWKQFVYSTFYSGINIYFGMKNRK